MIKFTIKWEASPRGIKRELGRIQKAAYIAAMELWHSEYRARHFTEEGARLYRYRPRKKSYERRKMRLKGHRRPLVYTGESKRRTQEKVIRATSKRGRVVLRAPGLNRRPRFGNINLREEMTTIAASERQRMIATFKREFVRGIRAVRTRETVRA